MDEVTLTPRAADGFAQIIGEKRAEEFTSMLARVRERLGGNTVWHVNSTATGGGVAEMLQSVLSYPLAAGIDVRWVVVGGNDAFFEVTKRIHHLLHGSSGDGGALGEEERRIYESTLQPEVESLLQRVQPNDVVVLHDPQTLGLAVELADRCALNIWACHVGADEPNDETRRAWRFLDPYVRKTVAQVFSRQQYAWEGLDMARVSVIPPCIDAFAPKNVYLDDEQVRAILAAAGVVGEAPPGEPPRFARLEGGEGRIEHRVELTEEEPIPADAPIVCQVSRWDPLKDHLGIMRAFSAHVPEELGAHLVLAGPSPESVGDDPEGQRTLDEIISGWHELDPPARKRVHVCCVPMEDPEENAVIINALQRRSAVVVQKSLAEGFGLTVAEAMWKGRPTLGSRVGGIQDQIDPDETGLLVDPEDPEEFGAAVSELLRDPDKAARLGKAAQQHVTDEYLAPTYLGRQFSLIEELLDRDSC